MTPTTNTAKSDRSTTQGADQDRAAKLAARFEKKTRWRYEKGGKDFGPFSPADLRKEMAKGDVTADTQVFEEGQQRWYRVADVPEFANYLFDLARQRQRQAEHADAERAEAAVRTGHATRRMVSRVAVLAILTGFGVTAYVMLTAATVEPSNFADGIYCNLELGDVPEWTIPTPETSFKLPIEKEVLPEKKAAANGTRKSGRRGEATANGGGSGPLVDSDRSGGAVVSGSRVTTMSFDDDEEGGGSRSLTSDEVQSVANRAAGKLRGCMAAEARRRDGFTGATVAFSIEPRGSLGGVRLLNGGMVSGALVSCVRKATGSIHIEPFSGGGRRIEIPIAVGAD